MIEHFREQGFSFSVNCVGYVFMKAIEVFESFNQCLHFYRKNSYLSAILNGFQKKTSFT